MAVKGFQTKFGYGMESSYGTGIAITHIIKEYENSIKPIVEQEDDEQICSTPDFQDKVKGITSEGGATSHDLNFEGFTKMLEGLYGSRTQSVLGAGYKQEFALTDEVQKSFTLAIDKIVNIWEFYGMKGTSFTFSGEAGRRWRMAVDWVGQGHAIPATVNTSFGSLTFPAAPYVHMNKTHFGIGRRIDVDPATGINDTAKTITFAASCENSVFIEGQYIMVFVDGAYAGRVKVVSLSGVTLTYTGSISPAAGTTSVDVWQLYPASNFELKYDLKLASPISASGTEYTLEPEMEDKREVTGSINMPKYYTDILTDLYTSDSYADLMIFNNHDADYGLKIVMPDCRNMDISAKDITGQGLVNDIFQFKAYAYSGNLMEQCEIYNKENVA